MIITDEKIEVTQRMMERANMVRGAQYGIPVDLKDISRGLRWKTLMEIEDEDFDTIEEYFLAKA